MFTAHLHDSTGALSLQYIHWNQQTSFQTFISVRAPSTHRLSTPIQLDFRTWVVPLSEPGTPPIGDILHNSLQKNNQPLTIGCDASLHPFRPIAKCTCVKMPQGEQVQVYHHIQHVSPWLQEPTGANWGGYTNPSYMYNPSSSFPNTSHNGATTKQQSTIRHPLFTLREKLQADTL